MNFCLSQTRIVTMSVVFDAASLGHISFSLSFTVWALDIGKEILLTYILRAQTVKDNEKLISLRDLASETTLISYIVTTLVWDEKNSPPYLPLTQYSK